VRRHPRVPDAVTGGRDTVGLRVPAQPLALELLVRFGGGVAAPSANRFGRVSPTTAAHVHTDLGSDVDLVLDGGPCMIGIESTIVDMTSDPPTLLRAGGIPTERIESVLGREIGRVDTGPSRAPGMLPVHYAPQAEVVIVGEGDVPAALAKVAGDQRIGVLAPRHFPDLPDDVVELEPAGDPEHYARHLYARLRQADRVGITILFVVPPEEVGLGVAVNDRLRRAASAGSFRD